MKCRLPSANGYSPGLPTDVAISNCFHASNSAHATLMRKHASARRSTSWQDRLGWVQPITTHRAKWGEDPRTTRTINHTQAASGLVYGLPSRCDSPALRAMKVADSTATGSARCLQVW